jgi:transposase
VFKFGAGPLIQIEPLTGCRSESSVSPGPDELARVTERTRHFPNWREDVVHRALVVAGLRFPRGVDTLSPDSGLGKEVLVPRSSKYPEQFRKEAVEFVRISDRPLRQVARDLGVNHETLRNWVTTAEKQTAQPSGGSANTDQDDLRTLRKRVAELEVEKEILRKAAAYFAQEMGR